MAAKLGGDTGTLPSPCSLNDVVCWHLTSRGRRGAAYTSLRSILRETTLTGPVALRQVAEIADLDLFITTTVDGYLEQAINEARFGGAQSTEVISYAPNRIADLATEREQMTRPTVYHLLGAEQSQSLGHRAVRPSRKTTAFWQLFGRRHHLLAGIALRNHDAIDVERTAHESV